MRKNKKLILISSILATTAMVVVPAISIVNNINTVSVSDSQLDNVVQNSQQVEMDGIDNNINTVEDNGQVKDVGDTFIVNNTTLMAAGWGTNITGNLIFTVLPDGKTVSVKADNKSFSAIDFIIKDTINNNSLTYNVTGITENAFYECSGLAGTLTIPASVTTIGRGAFYDCDFASINVSSDSKTFSMAENLGPCQAIIDNATGAFGSNSKIVGSLGYGKLIVPSTITYIPNEAFALCSGLTSVIIPSNITSIGNNAFAYCSGLTGTLTIPVSVTSIGQTAFAFCNKLTDALIIPNSVTTIDIGAFGFCSGLTSVSIPDSVTTIEMGAFSYCSGLTSVTIPNGVTSILDSTFTACLGLTSVIIGSGVNSIRAKAFQECKSIKEITILATTPPAIAGDSFDIFTATLHVPTGSEDLYKNDPIWSKFNIESISANDLNLGAIIGGTLGGLAGAGAIAGGITYGVKRSKAKK